MVTSADNVTSADTGGAGHPANAVSDIEACAYKGQSQTEQQALPTEVLWPGLGLKQHRTMHAYLVLGLAQALETWLAPLLCSRQ